MDHNNKIVRSQGLADWEPTETVLAVSQIDFEGNIIPHPWYKHLRYDSGKANLCAITILAEIVYWYRPAKVLDEATGQVIGYRRKFQGDKLQRSYNSFADQFELTKKQSRDAISFLVDKGVITKELRNIVSKAGMPLSNVLYLEPIPDKLKEISTPCDLEVTPPDPQVTPSDPEVTRVGPASQTYTENTNTETSTDIKEQIQQKFTSALPNLRNQYRGITWERVQVIDYEAGVLTLAPIASDQALLKRLAGAVARDLGALWGVGVTVRIAGSSQLT